jgi:hypothetical protein
VVNQQSNYEVGGPMWGENWPNVDSLGQHTRDIKKGMDRGLTECALMPAEIWKLILSSGGIRLASVAPLVIITIKSHL